MRIEMTKEKTILYLDTATVQALTDYARRHARRVRSKSDAADQLLQRALTSDMDEGTERILAPILAEIVRETARREILDQAIEPPRSTARSERQGRAPRRPRRGNRACRGHE